jgi:hypothetical protein
MNQLSFRQGWHSSKSTLGWVWPSSAGVAALLLLVGAAVLEARDIASASVARDAEAVLLQGVTFGLLLPLSCFALSARLDTGLDALMSALWVRHGAERRAFALGRLAFPVALTGAIALSAGGLALVLCNALGEPLLDLPIGLGSNGLELVLTAALGATSYVACLGLAQLLAGTWGRALFLIADWLLGSGVGVVAAPWPRAHLRALLGGHGVLGLSQAGSAAALLSIGALCLFLYLRRVPQ